MRQPSSDEGSYSKRTGSSPAAARIGAIVIALAILVRWAAATPPLPAAAQSPEPWPRVFLPLTMRLPVDWGEPLPSVTPAASATTTATTTTTTAAPSLPAASLTPPPSPTVAIPTPIVQVEGPRVTTAHYDLWVEGMDGSEVGRLLEAAYPRWAAFFQAAPGGRLPGKIYASAEAMAAGMAADGIRYGGGGG